jgi:hypothetical protein
LHSWSGFPTARDDNDVAVDVAVDVLEQLESVTAATNKAITGIASRFVADTIRGGIDLSSFRHPFCG